MNYISSDTFAKNELLDRFIKYVKIWTESSEAAADTGKIPSTDRQFDLAEKLSDELILLGLSEVQVTENCYVHGILNASVGLEKVPSMCWLAHLDTVEEVSGKDVKPIVQTMTERQSTFRMELGWIPMRILAWRRQPQSATQ